MNCPKCPSVRLEPFELLGKVSVDHCPSCDGMYFQKGEMGTYLKFSTDVPNYKDLLKAAAFSCICPECSGRMKELKYVPGEDLTIDLCDRCGGIWLDGQEIRTMESIASKQDDPKVRLMRGIWALRAKVRGERALTCPKCRTDTVFEFRTGEDVAIDMCDRCNGSWFDKGEVATFFELSKDVPNLEKSIATSVATSHPCPKCPGEKLIEFDYCQIELRSGRLRVDYCRRCGGLWLDKGEICSLEGLSTVLESPGSRLGRAVKELRDKGYVSVG